MDTERAYADRMDARMRATDARLDQLSAAARARNAKAEMDEISGLRAMRDRVRQEVADARNAARDDAEAMRRQAEADWSKLRRAVADAHGRYSAWDAARERRFDARLDQADAVLRDAAAQDAELAADARVGVGEAQNELRMKAAAARRSFDAWREERTDAARQRQLDDAELDLEEASSAYMAALDAARQRGQRRRAD